MKGVIFDFNGTLFWDTAFHSQAFDIFLRKYHIAFSEEEKRTKIYGKSNNDIMEAIFKRKLTVEEIKRYSLEKELIYQDLCRNDLQFAPGAETFFQYLKINHIPFTIGSSVGVENIDFYYKYMNLGKWFSRELIVYNDGNFRGKPQPDIFLAAAKKLHLQPQEIVIFEDSPAGIQAAENAGAGKIYIVNSNNDDYYQFSHPIIRHFNEVELPL